MGIFEATVQSALMSILSNVSAQTITCWTNNSPLSLNVVKLLQFVLFSVLSTPPNYLWQCFLEAQYPAYASELPHKEKEAFVDDAVSGKSTSVDDSLRKRVQSKTLTEKSLDEASEKPAKQLSIKNTAVKFTLDQTIGAAANTVLFIAGIALLRGQSVSSAFQDVQEQFWPMTFAGQKLWPAVSILSFTVVPFEYRMLFGSVAGLFWGIYLSLVAGG
ncbi:related to integral membrane protein, Mpv17/PMP22 family [Ramularia collo-cygni]|uniref:Related to integral membrane protein, Mpv17/PMP22 family n=1 Tax=Ramularia collo-cygni TaxID=112498 RepID=A0A2D3UPB2_9PEZI|nr:related to integral membrane protein, Mpv17/PMP22 family [Ramularia collo-cygni]CZT15678.1 related to integral membrane protein, Mpv17/PMP22 family [Ramularia collo-cygni]